MMSIFFDENKELNKWCKKGEAFLQLGKIEEAQSEFKEALKIKKDFVRARYGIARCYYKAWLSAQMAMREEEQQKGLIFLKMEGALDLLNLTKRAIKEYEILLQKEPDLADAHAELADLLEDIGRGREAVEHWQTALQLDPLCPLANLCLGRVDKHQDNFEAAIAKFKAGLRKDPSDYRLHFELGDALFKSGKKAESISHFQKSIRLKPDYIDALFNLGTAYSDLGNMSKALSIFKKFLKVEPYSRDAMHIREIFPELKQYQSKLNQMQKK
jgi:protein O-GlcNAc transferase